MERIIYENLAAVKSLPISIVGLSLRKALSSLHCSLFNLSYEMCLSFIKTFYLRCDKTSMVNVNDRPKVVCMCGSSLCSSFRMTLYLNKRTYLAFEKVK